MDGRLGDPPARRTGDYAGASPAWRIYGRAPRRGRTKGMTMRVFLAGAGGAIGARLVPQLIARGHRVTATTRSRDKELALVAHGARPVTLDGLDARAVHAAVAEAEPDVIVHQMTALAGKADMKH